LEGTKDGTNNSKKLAKVKTIQFGDKLVLNVIDQPSGRRAFVSDKPETITNLRLAVQRSVYEFIAHNFF
jgi:hypothetical protein